MGWASLIAMLAPYVMQAFSGSGDNSNQAGQMDPDLKRLLLGTSGTNGSPGNQGILGYQYNAAQRNDALHGRIVDLMGQLMPTINTQGGFGFTGGGGMTRPDFPNGEPGGDGPVTHVYTPTNPPTNGPVLEPTSTKVQPTAVSTGQFGTLGQQAPSYMDLLKMFGQKAA